MVKSAVPLHGVPLMETQLRQHIETGALDEAMQLYEQLLRRRRVPAQAVCTALLELCSMHSVRRAIYVLETMSECRGLEVDDYCRIVRLFILSRADGSMLARFEEIAIDIMTFADDGMHNYFAHLSSLLNIELQEQVAAGGPAAAELEVSLLTHKRQLETAYRLCKRGGTMTPIFALLLIDMGGREGVQDADELRALAGVTTGLAPPEAIAKADAALEGLESLNASQKAAASCCMQDRLTLVQGPPGSGKTTLAVQVLRLWVEVLGIKPALCCADSNVAVDNIAVALVAAGLRVVRPGRQDAIRPELHQYMPEALGGKAAIEAADVVLCTCIGSGADSMSKFTFAAVLIDEVAQSTEPATLVPLTHGCRQLVLVGDHKQLQPTVVSDEAARKGLRLSLFERLARAGVRPMLLDTQYRMHPTLAEYPSLAFYDGRLKSGIAAEARPQLQGFDWPSASCNVALIPSSAPEEGGGGASKRNPGEAATLLNVLRGVLNAGELNPSQIGIVTPYAAQVSQLRSACAGLPNARLLEIMSVDGFQGREKELILFSAVRAGRGGALGFVSDARRLNVLLTRARRGLVVVGEPRTLVNSPPWAGWLEWVERAGAACAAGWRAPPRPARGTRRERSPGRYGGESDDDDGYTDALGRKVRRSGRSASGERAPQLTRAERREQRRAQHAAAAAAAAAAGGAADDEAAWRQQLAEAAQAGGGPGDAAGAADVRTRRDLSAVGEPLMPNWYAVEDPAGRGVYYHNSATAEVCWQPPVASFWAGEGFGQPPVDPPEAEVEAAAAAEREARAVEAQPQEPQAEPEAAPAIEVEED